MFTHVPASIGKYLIQGELGRGATSSVYRARDTCSERDVAIKIFNHAALGLSSMRQNLSRAIEAIAERAKQKDVAQQYQNWVEFGKDLAALFRDVEIWLHISAWDHRPANRLSIREGDRGDGFFILIERLSAANKKLTGLSAET